ncbi:MAG: methyltransferase [Candidatus Aminicenantes bacterium]|nr:methyltransferase [Candidatus Aminicenantes bacterium]
MNSRERISAALSHRPPDILPCDFGGGFQTGIAVSLVYKLRQRLGLDPPGTPVKVVEVYQMLGEIEPDLCEWIGSDTVSLAGTGTMFGYPSVDFKEWRLADGTPVLVPIDFNTAYADNGDLFQYPGGDRTIPPSGRMPAGGHFFDAVIRQEPLDEARLDFRDNLEEFGPVSDAEIEHLRHEAGRLHAGTDKALFCTFGGLTFGDIALVPGVSLKNPRGIRDIEEWYVSLVLRPEYIKSVFARQAEIAVENLKKLHRAVGERISIIQTNGTDFGAQNGPFCSVRQYRDLFLPYQQKVNGWIHENTGWKTFMHCCGGIEPLLPAVIEAGFDILNPVQCSAAGMDPAELKKKYGSRIVFWGGGVDTQKTLPFGTPDQVRAEVEERVRIFGEGGGYVFNAIHNVVAGTPLDNLMALFETVRKFRSGSA